MNVKKGEKELAVYEAVCRLWHQGADLRGLTVQAIAAEAGIGKGTVYEYFTSREEILGKAFLYEIDRSLDRVEEKLAEAPAFGEKLNVLFAAADTLVRLEAAGMQVLASYLEGGWNSCMPARTARPARRGWTGCCWPCCRRARPRACWRPSPPCGAFWPPRAF